MIRSWRENLLEIFQCHFFLHDWYACFVFLRIVVYFFVLMFLRQNFVSKHVYIFRKRKLKSSIFSSEIVGGIFYFSSAHSPHCISKQILSVLSSKYVWNLAYYNHTIFTLSTWSKSPLSLIWIVTKASRSRRPQHFPQLH